MFTSLAYLVTRPMDWLRWGCTAGFLVSRLSMLRENGLRNRMIALMNRPLLGTGTWCSFLTPNTSVCFALWGGRPVGANFWAGCVPVPTSTKTSTSQWNFMYLLGPASRHSPFFKSHESYGFSSGVRAITLLRCSLWTSIPGESCSWLESIHCFSSD